MNIQSLSSPLRLSKPQPSFRSRDIVIASPINQLQAQAPKVSARNAHGDTLSIRFGSAEAASKGYRNDSTEQGLFSRMFSKMIHN
jgi:hypothetical protein